VEQVWCLASMISSRFCASMSFSGEEPLVNDQQGHLLVDLHRFSKRSLAPGDSKLVQQIRKPNAPCGIQPAAGCNGEGVSHERLASACCAKNDDIPLFSNVVVSCQPQYLGPVQLPIHIIADIFDTGVAILYTGVFQEPGKLVAFAAAPFDVHKKPEAFFKRHLVILRVAKLSCKRTGHGCYTHLI